MCGDASPIGGHFGGLFFGTVFTPDIKDAGDVLFFCDVNGGIHGARCFSTAVLPGKLSRWRQWEILLPLEAHFGGGSARFTQQQREGCVPCVAGWSNRQQ